MKVKIKDLSVGMEVKTKGVEFDVAGINGKHIGDLVVKNSGLVWCPGRTKPENGIKLGWKDFIALAGEHEK